MLRSFLCFLLVLTFLSSAASAQLATESRGVHVTAYLSETDGSLTLERQLIDDFRAQLDLRGIADEGSYQLQLLLDAKQVQIGGEARVILSVTRMESLPGAVIELGAKNEAFYLRTSMTDLPPEGKFVRQEMSRDWLGQFFNIYRQVLYVVEPSELERTVSDYVDELVSG